MYVNDVWVSYVLTRVTDEGPEFLVRSVVSNDDPLYGMGSWDMLDGKKYFLPEDAYRAGEEWVRNMLYPKNPVEAIKLHCHDGKSYIRFVRNNGQHTYRQGDAMSSRRRVERYIQRNHKSMTGLYVFISQEELEVEWRV